MLDKDISASYILPDWPAPQGIKAYSTTRIGGCSKKPFDSFNLAKHVDDNNNEVLFNREKLKTDLHLPNSPIWLEQIHSCNLVDLDSLEQISIQKPRILTADGSFTSNPNRICTVMTADCLPILLCNKKGTWVASIHAGWRGLADGIVQKAINAYAGTSQELIAWMGPAIGQDQFEVGFDVKQKFEISVKEVESFFIEKNDNKFLCDLYGICRNILQQYKIQTYGGQWCTYSQESQFFSYRRDGATGRMASLIWIDNKPTNTNKK